MEKEISLNLGCGNEPKKGFTNIDIKKFPGVDLICDIRRLDVYDDESVSLITAHEVIEHLPFIETVSTLKEWHRILRPGGTLYLTMPDLEKLCELFLENKDGKRWTWWHKCIYGNQMEGYPSNEHKRGFNRAELERCLRKAGDWGEIRIKNHGEYGRGIKCWAVKSCADHLGKKVF